jgi:hypothetical protein
MSLVYLLYNMCLFCSVLLNSAYKYILRNCELFHEIYYILVKKYTTLLINFVIYKEEFEDTKEAIIIRISKKNRQHTCQQKHNRGTNNDLQNIHIKLKIDKNEPH